MKLNPFTKKYRIYRQKEFELVFKNGKVFRTNIFKAYLSSNGMEFSRLAVVVSRKVGNAVLRNKVKRICREWFRKKNLSFSVNSDLIILFRNKIDDFSGKMLSVKLEEIIIF
ncbi:MAG: ribonuclease P protein component [Candidatus Aureabacteria bacterium]|nr:ribonuclease P protein component [Candidatus Auribacterota bacterium]